MPHHRGMGDTASTSALIRLNAPSKPNPAAQSQARILQQVLQRDPPGYGLANKVEQTNHHTGMVAISAKAYLDAVAACKFRVLERRPQTLTKSVSAGHYAQDEEYGPADPSHPLCRILEAPGGKDGVWSMQDECEFLALQFLLTGEAPAWTPVNDVGKPVQFFALTSALVVPQFGIGVDANYPQGAYRVMPYGGSAMFYAGGMAAYGALLPGEEVKRFKSKHAWARNMGYSPLQAGAKEVDVLNAMTESRWSYFDQGLQLDTLVMIPGSSPAEAEQLLGQLEQKHGGARKARRVLVVAGAGALDGTSGKFGVTQLGPPVREMDYTQSYDQGAGVVLAFYRVPKSTAGLTAASNYSGLFAEKQQFREYGLLPFFGRLSAFLTQSLARPWCDEDDPGQFKIEVEPPPLGDLEMDEKQFEHDVGAGLITYNQSLKKRNRRPVDGGDVPVSVYLAKLQQTVAPQPDPMQAIAGKPPAAPKPDSPPATPKPANPDAEGSLPERSEVVAKAASTLALADGAALVPEGAPRKPKKKDGRALVARVLKSLNVEE